MNLTLSEEQQMLRDSVAKLLQRESSPARVRAAEASGFDRALWAQLLATGMVTLRVPEARGGAAMGLFEAALVAEEAGRYLASVPLVEAMVAGALLAKLDGDGAARLLDDLLAGQVVLLHPRELFGGEAQALPTAANVMLALHGETVLAVRLPAGAARANLGSDSVTSAILVGEGALGEHVVIARGAASRAIFLAAIEEWKLLKAASLVGLASQALQMAAAYTRERVQFGRPIGAFQGIAHPLAEALTEVEGARLLAWRAIWAIAHAEPDAAATLSMAWWWSTQACANAVARALHAFGGYGVSLEYDIQLYYRRGKAWALLGGDPQKELLRVADRLWPAAGAPAPQLPDAGEPGIEFGVGREAAAFGAQVRRFFEDNLSDELRAHAHHSVAGYHPQFHRQLARAGLLFPHWPAQYGGSGKNAFDMAALGEVFEEFNWQRITGPITNQVAQIVMRFATEEVKQEVLPRFAAGEALACLGFTEPASGSDVFSARMRAVRDGENEGDDWIIEGQKIFTTAANLADYIFLLVRTDPDLPKHAGLTLFLVPMASPGIEVQAVHTVQDERTNIVYLSQVRVADRYRIGDVNGGTAVMSATLELEHGGDQYRISFSGMLRHAVQWAQSARRDGKPVIEDADARRRLARVAVHAAVARELGYRCIWATAGQVPGRAAYGPMSKLFSTERYQAAAVDLMDLAAPESLFAGQDDVGHIEIGYRQSIGMTIYGGTSEVHRSIIAEQGLGMPRSRT